MQMTLVHSFLWQNNIRVCVCVCVCVCIFIQSSVDGYFGCFHVLAIVHSTAVNIGVRVSFFFFFGSLGLHPRHMEVARLGV